MKKRGPLLAAFCIPLLITLIICVNREIYPFGDQPVKLAFDSVAEGICD